MRVVDDTHIPAAPSAIYIVDPTETFFQRVCRGVPIEIRGGVRAVAAPRALEGSAQLLISVLGRHRDWEFVGRLCIAGPTLVVMPAMITEDGLVAIGLGARGCLDLTVSTAALRAAIVGILAGEVAFSRLALGAWLHRQAF